MAIRLLLLSNSTNHGMGYLDHAVGEITDFLGDHRRLAFVPYALHDREAYGATVRKRLEPLGFQVATVLDDEDCTGIVDGAEAIFVGGGNTFRLLDRLHGHGLVDRIRQRALDGMPYIGSSAGTVIAAPTLKTTNDMPIVQPPTFDALGLVRFQINPHYVDPDPGSMHMGETRETRLREFHEENDAAVVGLREGAILRVEGKRMLIKGFAGARVFVKGRDPEEHAPGADLSFLLTPR
jgi:dipeptidase E